YGREVIDSTLVKGSFPPLMIPPINFDALFVQAMQQSQAKAEQVAAEEPSEGTTH
ncbi:MAG: preprotein translocase subunit SecB, partial [Bermanella sp.]